MRKCIYPSKIVSAAADSENINYPASNVLDEHPTLPWIAVGQSGTLILTVSGGSEGVAIFATNASVITVTVKDVNGDIVVSEAHDLSGIDTWYKWFTQSQIPQTELGLIYPYQSTQHTIEIYADSGNSNVPVEIGVADAGSVRRFRPSMDLGENPVDYSIRRPLSKGFYRKKKDVVRRYTGTLRVEQDTEFHTVMGIVQDLATAPATWWITDNENTHWLVYAGFEAMPSTVHHNRYSFISWVLLEEV